MGYAVAVAARQRGHDVVLVSGPVSIPEPAGVELVRVLSASDMRNAVLAGIEACDALVMAAAVCDMRPAVLSDLKIKKSEMAATLALERVPDILAEAALRKGSRIFVGFAAETGDPRAEAVRKLNEKNLDMIVGNDVSSSDSGFDSDNNRVCFFQGWFFKRISLDAENDVALRIVEWIESTRPGLTKDDRRRKSQSQVKARNTLALALATCDFDCAYFPSVKFSFFKAEAEN